MFATPLHNEKELISCVAKGDEKAFRLLFDHYWQKIYTVALTLTKSVELSEEIVQDVFLKIWLKKEALPSVVKFDAYLFITARNHILNQLRSKKNSIYFIEHLEQHFRSSAISPEQAVLLKETYQLINEALDNLPLRQREVYRLSRNEGLDNTAIAQELGISKLTVKSHLTKALQSIRHHLQAAPEKLLLFVAVEQLLH